MTQRPYQHQLEEQSLAQLQLLLPAPWVFRREAPDYGIDGSVEIIDEAGRATALRFLVQLKSTSALRNLTARIRRATADYYAELDLPVMVALWHAPTGTLYWRCFHECDPYYGGFGNQWVTLRYDNTHAWTANTPARVEADLTAFRMVRGGQLALPLAIALHLDADTVGGQHAATVRAAVARVATALPGILRFSTSLDAPIRLTIDETRIVCSFGGRYSATIHLTDRALPPDLHSEVFVLCALVLSQAGHDSLAAQLAAEGARRSTMIAKPAALQVLIRSVTRSGQVGKAIAIAETLVEREDDASWAAEAFVLSTQFSPRLSAGEQAFVAGYYAMRRRQAEKRGDGHGAGVAAYNCARVLEQPPLTVLRGYRDAARLHDDYLKRDYYWKELGTLFFNAQRYAISAGCYRCAVELGGVKWRPLLADALMFSGRYDEAVEQFDIAAEEQPLAAEWQLKHWAMRALMPTLGVTSQRRRPRVALDLLNDGRSYSDVDAVVEVLGADALCANAWFNLGVAYARAQQVDEACVAFMMSALIQRHDAEAWSNTFMSCVHSEQYFPLLQAVAEAAYQGAGEEFINQALSAVMAQSDDYPKDVLIDAVERVAEFVRSRRRPETVEARLSLDNGGYESTHLPRHPNTTAGT